MTNRILIQPFGVEHTFFIRTLIGMRTEVVTLCLNQVRWENGSTIAVIVCHRSGEGRNRDTVLHRVRNNITQRLLIFVSNLLEVRRQQKVRDTCIFSISIGDFLQELSANDTTGTEDLRNLTVVQIPVIRQMPRAAERSPARKRRFYPDTARDELFLRTPLYYQRV